LVWCRSGNAASCRIRPSARPTLSSTARPRWRCTSTACNPASGSC
jgi:hypothetical protein